MPAKRQAPAASAAEGSATKKPSIGGTSTAGTGVTAVPSEIYKYSNPESLEKDLPDLISCLWPRDEDSDEEAASETEAECREREAKNIRVVDDMAWPATKAGFELFKKIDEEQRKRDPDRQNVYISNDWAGYGMMEVLANHFTELNKIIFKKDVSPLIKWAYTEAVIVWTQFGDMYSLMMNDDSEGVTRTLDMLITLLATSFEMLSEHSLTAETSAVSNAGAMALFAIKVLKNDAKDTGYKLPYIHEIVRAADTYGVVLTPRKEFGVNEDTIDELRKKCKGAAKRGNWKTEYAKYKRTHPGGTKYDITKMSAARKAEFAY